MNKETTHQINLALRTAAGHARAAFDVLKTAEGTYEMKMKSAGASVWEAWSLAVKAQPEYVGRKLDEKALVRIYESTKARPWWDRHLAAVSFQGKPVNREWAKRTMQWHVDPDAARARRAKDNALSAANYKKRKEKVEAQGRPRPQAGAPSTAEMKEVGNGWTPQEVREYDADTSTAGAETRAAREELDRLLERISKATRTLTNLHQLAEAEALLRLAAEGLEAL